MKLLVLAICIASAAAVAKKCKTGDDCGEDECCVNYALTPLFGGRCRATRKEGESCTPLLKKNEEEPDMYHYQCPCKEGLACVAEQEFEIFGHVIRHRPECIVPYWNQTLAEGEDGNVGGEIGQIEAE